MAFNLRPGTHGDAAAIADLVIAAGNGIFEQLFEGVSPGLTAVALVTAAIAGEGINLSYSNALLAEEDGRVCGVALAYPALDFGLPAVVEGIIPRERMEPLRELLQSRVEGSYYLNTLAVAPRYRGRGFARLLLQATAQIAQESGSLSLSLHARTGNLQAMRLYQSVGFRTVRLIAVPATPFFRRAETMALMQAPLPLASAPDEGNSSTQA